MLRHDLPSLMTVGKQLQGESKLIVCKPCAISHFGGEHAARTPIDLHCSLF